MTPEAQYQIYRKVTHYCSYQERTTQEVCAKLRQLGVMQQEEQEKFIVQLREERFLNEERYVATFVQSKLLTNRWGKRKVRAKLAQKGFTPAQIHAGLELVPDEAYSQILRTVAERKQHQLPGKDPLKDQQRLTHFLLQKGYEADLVAETVSTLFSYV